MYDPYDEHLKKMLLHMEENPIPCEASGIDQIYLHQALKSAKRAQKFAEEKKFIGELSETASSIVFAALATEAIISEYITHFEFSSTCIPEKLKKIRNTLDPIAKWKILLKFNNPDIDLGSIKEFLKLQALTEMRNSVVHRQARLLLPNVYPEKIENFMRMKVIERPNEFRGSWMYSLLNYKMGKWAVKASIDWIEFSSQYVEINEASV